MAVTNGDFETGNLNGWTVGAWAGQSVISSDKHGGTYSCSLGPAGYVFDDQWFCQQTVSLTDIDTIKFWRKWPDNKTGFKLYIYRDPFPGYGFTGGTKLYEESSPGTAGEWAEISVDISSLGLSGNHLISFCLYWVGPGLTTYPKYVYLDDIVISIPEVAPVASFTTDKTTGGMPCTVQFTDSSTNTPTSWLWDFDDGETSTDQNPEHIFADSGVFHVVLTATNGGGSSVSDAITITVTAAPVADFTYYISGNIVFFTDTSGETPTSWNWYFGDGSPQESEQNPQHRYKESGTVTVTLTATNSEGSDTKSKDIVVDLFSASITSTTVSKGINDLMWICRFEVDGLPSIDSRDITVYMKDHTDRDQLIFMGYIPNPTYDIKEGELKTGVSAYSYFWYLTKQYLPVLETDNTGPHNTLFYNNTTSSITPTSDIYNLRSGMTVVDPGESVYINIKKYIEALLGGIKSLSINGLTIHEVVDCDDWNDGIIKNKGFDFVREDITVMDAINEIKDYLSYYFLEVFYNSSPDLDYAIFVPDTATDDQLHVPSKVTFEYPDPYISGAIRKEDNAGNLCNRVRVRCNPGILTDTFTATSSPDTFVLNTAHPGRAESCSISILHGAAGYVDENAPTYSGITYYVGDMVTYYSVVYVCIQSGSGHPPDESPLYWSVYEPPEVTEHLSGGAVDWVTLNNLHYTPTHSHSDIVTVTYLPDVDYYEQTIKTAGVTAETEKPIDSPPVYDLDGSLGLTTQDEVDEYANALFALYQTDTSIYHVTLAKRTDLRLLQLIKFKGFSKVPSDDMRIIHITYRKGPGGIFVDIQCILDRVLTLQRILKECTTISDVNLIERIIDKKVKQTNNEQTMKAWVVKTQGDVATVQTDTGVFVEKENV